MKNFSTALVSRRRSTQSGVTLALALSLGIAAHAQTPIVSYSFNDSSNAPATVSSGSDALPDATLTFYPDYLTANGSTNTTGDLHGVAGTGVSGAANDIAFDNSNFTAPGASPVPSGMGSNGNAGSALSAGIVSGLNNALTSFTVTGWFKSTPASGLNFSARLIDCGTGAPEIAILGTRGGEIQFLINGQKAYSNNSYNQAAVWTFFAVAYDSTAGAATFYVGYRPQDSVPGVSSPVVTSIGGENSGGTGGAVPFSSNPGTATFTGPLDVGNSISAGTGNNRGFAGLLDDFAIYGTALTQAQLELIRQANLAPPSSGSVSLQNVQSGNLGQPMVFTFTPTGTTPGGVTTQTVTLNASDGTFALAGVVPGTYTLGVKGAKWLQKDVAVDTTAGPFAGLSVPLLGGDVNNNNAVSLSDYVLLSKAYNSTPASANWNPAADLNCDGKVSLADYIILSSNYNKQGDK